MNIARNSYQEVLAEARAHRARQTRQVASGLGLCGLGVVLLVWLDATRPLSGDQWCSYEDAGVCTLVDYE